MKAILFSILLIVSQLSIAQDSTSVSSQSKRQFLISRLTEELNLSPEQQDQVRTIIETRSQAISNAKAFQRGTDEFKNGIKSANQSAKQGLQSVLTEEQFNTFVSVRKSVKDQKDRYYAQTGETPPTEDEETDF